MAQYQNTVSYGPDGKPIYTSGVTDTPTMPAPIQSAGSTPSPVNTSSFTPAQLQAYNYAASLAPTIPKSISSVSLATPLTAPIVPLYIAPQSPANDATALAQQLITQQKAQALAEIQSAQGNVDTSLSDLKSLYDTLGTKSQAQNDLEAQQGLPEKNQALRELNNQLMSTNASALQASQISEQRQAPNFAIHGEQDAIERKRAVLTYSTAAAITALNGEISSSQNYITKSIAAQFDPIEQRIQYQQQLLNVNRDTLTSAQREKADALNNQLDIYKTQITQQKEDYKTGQNLAISAMKLNPNDPQALYAAQEAMKLDPSSPTYLQDVAQLVGPYQSDPIKTQQDIADLQLTRAQTAKAQKDATTASESGYDPGEILAYAQQYGATGQIPTGMPKGSFGIVSQIAKETPKADGTLINNSTGIVPSSSSLPAAQVDGLSALFDLTKKLDALKNFYTTTPAFGSSQQQRQQYTDNIGEIVDLLARARSGAALTEDEVRNYTAKLPPTLGGASGAFIGNQANVQRIIDLTSSISGKLNTSLTAHNASIVGFSKVKIGDQLYTVGQMVTNSKGEQGVVNSDGTITIL